MPGNGREFPRRYRHDEDHDDKSKKRLESTESCVIARLSRYQGADKKDGDGSDGGEWPVEEFGNHLVTPEDGMVPYDLGWSHDIFDGNPEEDDAQRNGEVNQEGDQPILGVPKLNKAKNPPAVGAQRKVAFSYHHHEIGDMSSQKKTTRNKSRLTR